MDFAPSGWGIEPWGGASGGGGGGLPPFVTNILPAPGTLIASSDVIEFDVLDTDSLIQRIIILARYATIKSVEAIYEVPGFTPQFTSLSTVTVITNGYHFRIARRGGWPDNTISLMIDAIDVDGNED